MTFPCRICNKSVNDNDHAIQCDICNFWVHIKFHNLNYTDYKYLQGSNDPWHCITRSSSIFPFNCLNDKTFGSLLINQTGQSNNFSFDNKNSSLLLNPSPKLTHLVNQFNNDTIDNNNVADNFIHSKYFDIDEIQKLKIPNTEKCLSLFHINACSLKKIFDELQYLLKSTNKNFDVIAVTETRIKKDISISITYH